MTADHDLSHEELADFLASCPPLDGLSPGQLALAADQADIEHYRAGEEILNAFHAKPDRLFAVWRGRVDLWGSPDRATELPDQTLTRGRLFGFVAALTGGGIGPRAVAVGDAVIIRLDAALVAPAFASRRGASFLAHTLYATEQRRVGVPTYTLVDDLIEQPPSLVAADATLQAAAQLMTAADLGYAAVLQPGGGYGLLTDAAIRRAVGDGLSMDSPVTAVLDPAPASIGLGASAAEALIQILERDAEYVLILDRTGVLRGAVAPRDFVVSATTAGAALHEQIRRAAGPQQLASLTRQVPGLLGDLLARGLAPSRVITVHSALVDTVVRRAIELVLQRHPDVDQDAFTWLSLGSNGRREAVLSSDIDAAVAFDDAVDADGQERLRRVFSEVVDVMAEAGLRHDRHGVSPTNAQFARTHAQWRAAGRSWLYAAATDDAVIMTCLMVDGRPVAGDLGLPDVARVFGGLRRHPGTMQALLGASVTPTAAASRLGRLAMWTGTDRSLNVKAEVLLPIVNVARWAALSVGSAALPTGERLAAAAGSAMLVESDAQTLGDAFEVVQGIRLQHQLDQLDRSLPPDDTVKLRDLSAIDRSSILQAVREVAAIQRRMANMASYVLPEMHRSGPRLASGRRRSGSAHGD